MHVESTAGTGSNPLPLQIFFFHKAIPNPISMSTCPTFSSEKESCQPKAFFSEITVTITFPEINFCTALLMLHMSSIWSCWSDKACITSSTPKWVHAHHEAHRFAYTPAQRETNKETDTNFYCTTEGKELKVERYKATTSSQRNKLQL